MILMLLLLLMLLFLFFHDDEKSNECVVVVVLWTMRRRMIHKRRHKWPRLFVFVVAVFAFALVGLDHSPRLATKKTTTTTTTTTNHTRNYRWSDSGFVRVGQRPAPACLSPEGPWS